VKKKFVVNDVVCADSKTLSKFIKPNSVALTVTSPPYRNAINYSQHVKNLKGDKKKGYRGNVGGTLEGYLADMEKIFSQVRRVTMPGGFCCIVIADEIDEGTLLPLPSYMLARLLDNSDPEEGWHLRDIIVWNKVTAGRSGAGNRFAQFIKIPVPTRYRANIMHEYILILQKGKKARMLPQDTKEKIPLNRAMKRQVAQSIWDMTPVPPNVVDHPAVFPEQIPWRLIHLFTVPGDVVLDPMCGSGQTVKVANHLKRNYIGVDIRKEYAKLAKKRLKEKFMLSNFIIPLYFPIKWSKAEQAGGKADAHLDVADRIPKGYKMIFQKTLKDEEYGTDTRYIYYKNKAGDYLCCVISSREQPFLLKIGMMNGTSSPLKKIFRALPNSFSADDVSKILPSKIANNMLTASAVVDVFEHSKLIHREKYLNKKMHAEKLVKIKQR